MDSSVRTKLDGLLDVHGRAVDEFFMRAAQVPGARWNTPRADGKWTPAQEVKHLILAYEAFTQDLTGGEPMKLVGTPFKRWLWRLVGLTMVLRMNRLPKGARAPREVRPPEGALDQEAMLADFRARTTEFVSAFRETWGRTPERHVMHPYFGKLSLTDALQMSTVHTRHHTAVLPPLGARQQVGG